MIFYYSINVRIRENKIKFLKKREVKAGKRGVQYEKPSKFI